MQQAKMDQNQTIPIFKYPKKQPQPSFVETGNTNKLQMIKEVSTEYSNPTLSSEDGTGFKAPQAPAQVNHNSISNKLDLTTDTTANQLKGGIHEDELYGLMEDDEELTNDTISQNLQQDSLEVIQLRNQHRLMISQLDLYSELYAVHRVSQYKFIESKGAFSKSFADHAIMQYVKVEEDYLNKLINTELEIDQDYLQNLLRAFIGIEYFGIHPNHQNPPPNSQNGYNLEITISLKYPGTNNLHFMKYGGVCKNSKSQVHSDMINNDPCMVLLKETLPDYYHAILFRLVKKALISKNKVASVSTSASSHGDFKVNGINTIQAPQFTIPPQNFMNTQNPVFAIQQQPFQPILNTNTPQVSGVFSGAQQQKEIPNPQPESSTPSYNLAKKPGVIFSDSRSVLSSEHSTIIQTLSSTPNGPGKEISSSKIKKTFKYVLNEFTNSEIKKVEYWSEIKNYKVTMEHLYQMKKKKEFIKQANDYILSKNWPSFLNLLIQKVHLVAMDLVPKNFKTIHFCLKDQLLILIEAEYSNKKEAMKLGSLIVMRLLAHYLYGKCEKGELLNERDLSNGESTD